MHLMVYVRGGAQEGAIETRGGNRYGSNRSILSTRNMNFNVHSSTVEQHFFQSVSYI